MLADIRGYECAEVLTNHAASAEHDLAVQEGNGKLQNMLPVLLLLLVDHLQHNSSMHLMISSDERKAIVVTMLMRAYLHGGLGLELNAVPDLDAEQQ